MNEFNLMNWDMEPHLKSKKTISRQEKFTSFGRISLRDLVD